MDRKSSTSSIDDIDHQERKDIVDHDRKDYFCVDVEQLTKEETKANIKFLKIRDDLMSDGQMHFLDGYYKSQPVISGSKLFTTLNKMPKGGHLHLHLTAACKIDYLMELTKEDYVYYNEKANLLKVFVEVEPLEGYVKCNELRETWQKEGTFDEYIYNKILLTEEDISSKHSSTIWKNFQFKFDLAFHLYNYYKFFERVLTEVMLDSIKEK